MLIVCDVDCFSLLNLISTLKMWVGKKAELFSVFTNYVKICNVLGWKYVRNVYLLLFDSSWGQDLRRLNFYVLFVFVIICIYCLYYESTHFDATTVNIFCIADKKSLRLLDLCLPFLLHGTFSSVFAVGSSFFPVRPTRQSRRLAHYFRLKWPGVDTQSCVSDKATSFKGQYCSAAGRGS